MKTLYLLRHAKSSWDDPNLADFDRPLNDRGRSAAPFMGELMANRDLSPDLILSSPAERAKQTAELVRKASGNAAEIRHEELIYEASPQMLLQIASAIKPRFDSAMIVGHNPGIESFIRVLTKRSERMPTAALAVIDLDIDDWSKIAPASGSLRELIRPKDEMRTFGKGN